MPSPTIFTNGRFIDSILSDDGSSDDGSLDDGSLDDGSLDDEFVNDIEIELQSQEHEDNNTLFDEIYKALIISSSEITPEKKLIRKKYLQALIYILNKKIQDYRILNTDRIRTRLGTYSGNRLGDIYDDIWLNIDDPLRRLVRIIDIYLKKYFHIPLQGEIYNDEFYGDCDNMNECCPNLLHNPNNYSQNSYPTNKCRNLLYRFHNMLETILERYESDEQVNMSIGDYNATLLPQIRRQTRHLATTRSGEGNVVKHKIKKTQKKDRKQTRQTRQRKQTRQTRQRKQTRQTRDRKQRKDRKERKQTRDRKETKQRKQKGREKLIH